MIYLVMPLARIVRTRNWSGVNMVGNRWKWYWGPAPYAQQGRRTHKPCEVSRNRSSCTIRCSTPSIPGCRMLSTMSPVMRANTAYVLSRQYKVFMFLTFRCRVSSIAQLSDTLIPKIWQKKGDTHQYGQHSPCNGCGGSTHAGCTRDTPRILCLRMVHPGGLWYSQLIPVCFGNCQMILLAALETTSCY
jgi:hypothetical protein